MTQAADKPQKPEDAQRQQADSEEAVSFGFEQVSPEEKTRRVGGVFAAVADRYDLMNDLMSLGVHRLWKRFAIELSAARPGQTILDLAGGTGDLASKFSKLVGDSGQVVLADINSEMLSTGRNKLIDKGTVKNLHFLQTNAEALPLKTNSVDCITIAFGLRNVTDKQKALTSMLHVLKPGGRLLVLEFSKPTSEFIGQLYDLYSFKVLPLMGKVIAQDGDSYRYLAESIRRHPDQEALLHLMNSVGFIECSYHNMTAGIVALHKGIKP